MNNFVVAETRSDYLIHGHTITVVTNAIVTTPESSIKVVVLTAEGDSSASLPSSLASANSWTRTVLLDTFCSETDAMSVARELLVSGAKCYQFDRLSFFFGVPYLQR